MSSNSGEEDHLSSLSQSSLPISMVVDKVCINGFAIRGPGFQTASGFLSVLKSQKNMTDAKLEGRDHFDNAFFHKSSQEAECTDPQIRLLLELTYQALVESGVVDFSNEGSLPLDSTGVYIGSSFGDFHKSMLSTNAPVEGHEHTGAAGTMMANSISRHFGFKGPSMKIDSACSSGLQALDIACGDIRSGKIKMAVVGGANMILDPSITAVYDSMGVLSASSPSCCKPFSSAADGYVRQEAVTVLVLSNEDVVKSGSLLSVAEILGSCTVSGRGKSVTSPDTQAQEMLYQKVATMAAPHVQDGSVVRYVECHATGTKLGDEVEATALCNALRSSCVEMRKLFNVSKSALLVGSVKSNIGHTEGAAGLVGLIKVLLSFEAGEIYPNLNYSHKNHNSNCNGLDDVMKVVVDNAETIEHDAIAVVNSFGFGGTYVQVMVRGVSRSEDSSPSIELRGKEPWMNIKPVFGRSEATARTISSTLVDIMEDEETFSVPVGVPGVHTGDFNARAFTTPVKRKVHTFSPPENNSRPVWLIFSGNGEDWPSMGSDLYTNSLCYKETFDRYNAYLLKEHDCDSLQRLLKYQKSQEKAAADRSSVFGDITDATVCLTVLQMCLIDMLRVANFTRDACDGYIGYSAGEIAAGYFDGCLTWQTTLDVALKRGQAAASVAAQQPAGMCVVSRLSREEVESLLMKTGSSLDIACHTGPSQVTLSGLQSELDAMGKQLLKTYPRAKIIPVKTFGVPFHSRLLDDSVMATLSIQLEDVFKLTGQQKRSSKWVSTCYKASEVDGEYAGPAYYCAGFRGCVEFDRAREQIPNNAIIIECGPNARFGALFKHPDTSFLPLLQRGENEVDTLATVYGNLFLQKVPLSGISDRRSPRQLFTAPKQRSIREAFFSWVHDQTFSKFLNAPNQSQVVYDNISIPNVVKFFSLELDLHGKDKWLLLHQVDGKCLLPAAVYLYAIWKHLNIKQDEQSVLDDFKIHKPINLSDISVLRLNIQFETSPVANSGANSSRRPIHIRIYSHVASKASGTMDMLVASGSACLTATTTQSAMYQESTAYENGAENGMSLVDSAGIRVQKLYQQLGRHGYEYKNSFQVFSSMDSEKKYASITSVNSSMKSCVLLLEGVLQFEIVQKMNTQYGPCHLPVGIDQVCFSQPMSCLDTIDIGMFESSFDGDCKKIMVTNKLSHQLIVQASGIQLQCSSSTLTSSSSVSVGKVERASVLSSGTPIEIVTLNTAECQAEVDVHYLKCDHLQDNFDAVKLCVQKSAGSSNRFIVVSSVDGFYGFIRSLQKEPGYAHVRGVQLLHHAEDKSFVPHLERTRQIFAENDDDVCLFINTRDGLISKENNTQLNDDVEFPSPNGNFLALSTHQSAKFYCWKPKEMALDDTSKVASVAIEIAYSSLNFRDVMIGSGRLQRDKAITGFGSGGGGLGLDFAGYLQEDSREELAKRTKVIGLGCDCIADNLFHQPKYLCWELNDHDNLEDFATVPCAYATAYYSLCLRGNLKQSDYVLIHCGAGGVGSAALHICKRRLKDPNSQLFVTCSNDAKSQYLQNVFNIPKENIADSRSPSFKDLVMKRTNGRGVNLVLNSLAGELMTVSVQCLSYGGHLLELGKGSIEPSVMLELRHKDRQLAMIDLDQLMADEDAFGPVREYINEGLRSKEIVPLKHTIFSMPDEIDRAFTHMLSGEHIGKIVLKNAHPSTASKEPSILVTLPKPSPAAKKPVIVVVGGLGGLGLCLAQWLSSRLGSACTLLLCSRSPLPITFDQQCVLQYMREVCGTVVDVRTGDLSSQSEVDSLLSSLADSNGVEHELFGFFNVAAATNDMLFDRMGEETWKKPFASKSCITSNFSKALADPKFADLTASLHYFVCISSIVTERGNAGQTNYASANAAMEEVVLQRASSGLKGLCIRLGLVRHTGLANLLTDDLNVQHLLPLGVEDVMVHLERLIVGGKNGLYAIYGAQDGNNSEASSSIPVLLKNDRQAAVRHVLDFFQKHSQGGKIEENTLITNHAFDSLGTIVLHRGLKQLGLELSLDDLAESTPMKIAMQYSDLVSVPTTRSNKRQEMVVITTIGKVSLEVDQAFQKKMISDALCSIRDQTHQPKYIFIVFEDSSESEMVLTQTEVLAILPGATIIQNERSKNSTAGALNSGVMSAFSKLLFDDHFWVLFLDMTKHFWEVTHLEHCARCITDVDQSCEWIVIDADKPCATLPTKEEIDFFLQPASRSCWVLSCSVFMESGMFDEALSSTIDFDLSIRICDVMLFQNNKQCRVVMGLDTVKANVRTAASEGGNDDADLFLYKHYSLMKQDQLLYTIEKLGLDYDAFQKQSSNDSCDLESQYDLVSFPTWSEVCGVKIRRDTNAVLSSLEPASSQNSPVKKTLVGITTNDHRRIKNLLADLGCMLNDKQHSVVVFTNSSSPDLVATVQKILHKYKFRGHVIRSTDRIVTSLFPSVDSFPIPIAKARTVLQTFLHATTKCEDFDVLAVLDDDMRLPKDWGVRDEDEKAGDILLGRAIKTPPNVTVMSMRTQLLDFVYALDKAHASSCGKDVAADCSHGSMTSCPSQKVFNNMNDQYYDLSSQRWDHLETPRAFAVADDEKMDDFVDKCMYRILVGDPLAREAVSVEEGQSFQRGGCMVLLKKNFSLLQTEQLSPTVELASGKSVASRRSDTFWVQFHCMEEKQTRAVARRHLSFLHDNTYDSVPTETKMRESVALEMIGAILCRPSETREAFSRNRICALSSSIARIRGMCKTLKGREYYPSLPKLKDCCVEYFEKLFDAEKWKQEVFDVMNKHVNKLKSWNACEVPKSRDEVSSYKLDMTESTFLTGNLPLLEYPDARAIRFGPMMPVPCLHRIHQDDKVLEGAQNVQEKIGMSLSVSDATFHLQQLSTLAGIFHNSCSQNKSSVKAIVTVDDGFRDILLLRDAFKELSDTIQPVLCIPSSLLRDNFDVNGVRRHLPLTCLYDYCFKNNIDPEAETLGDARRTALKTLPEKDQYLCLQKMNIPIDIPTDDLLSIADLKELSEEGWWICSHGPDHSDLTTSPSFDTVLDELKKDFSWIRKQGWTPWFAWPEGKWCARIADALSDQNVGCSAQFGLSSPPKGEPQHPAVVSRVAWFGGKRKPRVMVTGSDGFLGKHLVLVLQAYGYDICRYDIASGFDILNKDQMVTELRKNEIQVCIHLAAVADLNEAEEKPSNAHRVNVEGTRIVLSCCDELGVRLLFASTCCAYGNNGVVGSSSELSPVVPTEIYAETKVLGEELVLGSSRVHDLRHVAMRLATFYGPDMRPALATAIFLKAAENKEPIYIHGTGEQTRCFTHVHDIAEGIRVVLQTASFSGVVNIADDREVSVNELANISMRIAGNKVDIIKVEDRKGQIRKSQINNDRLRGLGNLGWTPTVSLEDGLRDCTLKAQNDHIPQTSSVSISVKDDSSTHAKTSEFVLGCKIEQTVLPVKFNEGDAGVLYVTEVLPDKTELIAYVVGDVFCSSTVTVRIHSECFNGDVLGSLKCDCGPQKDKFLRMIGKKQPGVFVYVKGHEGRGAGLLKKTRAYGIVDVNPQKHHNDALLEAGATQIDSRKYDAAALMLLRVLTEARIDDKTTHSKTLSKVVGEVPSMTTLVLHTNNIEKVNALRRAISDNRACFGHFSCQQHAIPAGESCSIHNMKYLKEKEKDNGQSGLSIPAIVTTATSEIPDSVDKFEGLKTVVNETIFNYGDPGIDKFIQENGFVIIRGLVSNDKVERANSSYKAILDKLYTQVCARVGENEISFEEFSRNTSQFRDLFLRKDEHGAVFDELVRDDSPASLASMATKLMTTIDPVGEWDSIKLLHDHIITKPKGLLVSKKIPLHQDRMFWPVDTPGCSTWTPLADVELDGGCMEVMTLSSKPHLHKQSTLAVDFMADEVSSGLEMMLQEDPNTVRWLLPMKAGDTLVFSSNVWHRSSPNEHASGNRLAYIQTWVHPHAHWRPDLVPWHPVNEYLSKEGYQPGDSLGGERHPTIGHATTSTVECEGYKNSIYARKVDESSVNYATKKLGSDISMFDASDVISTQIRNIVLLLNLGESAESASLVDIIKNPTWLQRIVSFTQETLSLGSIHDEDNSAMRDLVKESGCQDMSSLLSWALWRIMISTVVYACDRSRNVFNSAYKAWWDIAGAAWNKYFLDGKFKDDFKLCKTDVNRFLEYIHVQPGSFNHDSKIDKLGLLKAIIRGCFEFIPFQNLTMLTRIDSKEKNSRSPPTLGQVIGDMVTGLGGTCSVRNPFLFLLLKALNFDNVRFVAGTMCFSPPEELENAHVVILVNIDEVDYWVDIANGWPYLDTIPLEGNSGSTVIKHQVLHTRLVKKKKRDVDVLVVEHLFDGSSAWKENYYFQPEVATSYEDAFGKAMHRHYDNNDTFGHFLKHIRFNLWTVSNGVMLRDSDLMLLVLEEHEEPRIEKLDLWDASLSSNFEDYVIKSGFIVERELANMMSDAWFQCQKNAGIVTESEKITVTGGFFNQTAHGYIGVVTVWRSCSSSDDSNHVVKGLTFNMVKEYVPENFPVVNKGFAGGSWYENKLYVCWPNRVAIIDPSFDWNIEMHIDHPVFNDLHHVHACNKGVWVANTGDDSIDHLSFSSKMISRCTVAHDGARKDSENDVNSYVDIRSQSSHSERRGRDQEHVNYVSVNDDEQMDCHTIMATLLQSKRILSVEEKNSTTEVVTTTTTMMSLNAKSPPHEGFLHTVPSISNKPLMWNSTVDGRVVASDPKTGEIVKSWDLSEMDNVQYRGWTRGLCILRDGFLVGCTAIRGNDAKKWIEKHGNIWNFDTDSSQTAVTFVPFDSNLSKNGVKGVKFLSSRQGKVFSLLHTPQAVSNTL